jgi:hypothetical protein
VLGCCKEGKSLAELMEALPISGFMNFAVGGRKEKSSDDSGDWVRVLKLKRMKRI